MKWHRLSPIIIVVCSLFLWNESSAKGSGSKYRSEVQKQINALIKKSGLRKDQLGIYISDSTEGVMKTTFDLNSSKAFIPASTTKIMTAGAALEKFPVGHQFLTELRSDGLIQGSTLKGNIYLTGGGDAGFVSESLWFLVNEFMRNGIAVIQGDIIVDDTLFDDVRFDPGRDPERRDRAYDAPIGAMTFNWSSANVFVRPNDKTDAPAKVYVDPENRYIKLVNKATTGKPGSGLRIRVTRLEKDEKDSSFGDTIVVSGSIGLNHAEKVYYKSITQPDYWSGFHLLEFFRQRGIEVGGGVRVGKTPGSARTLATAKSKSIGDLVKDMMKFSNNYVAEILTKNLGAEFRSTPGTMGKGLEVLNEYIQSKGIKAKDYHLASPSGLSKKNKFRPKDIHKILTNLKSNFSVFAEYLSSNPIGGVDGTLKRRMKKGPAFGRVRAKTGHLTGVTGLAGYAGRADGQEHTFVYMYNGSGVKAYQAQKLFDDISAILLK